MGLAKYATMIVWATVVLATSVNAQPMPNRFRQLDRDGDGRVTWAEAGNARWFARLDRHSDGAITVDELRGRGAAVSDQDESAEIRAELSSKVVAHRDIRYAETADVAANLQSLDVYTAEGGKTGEATAPKPVVIMIHGGG